jgi:hypothetical protein
MEDNKKGYLNPWVSIWTKPRATIQQIVDDNPKYCVLLLAVVGTIPKILSAASREGYGNEMSLGGIFLLATILGSAGGIFGLYVAGWLLRWTGRWIGGQASSQHIRTAFAWANVPDAFALLLWVPLLIIIGQELFTSETPRIDANLSLSLIYIAFQVIQITAGIWTLVILVKCLGQVQGFSAWKAILNIILLTIVSLGVMLLMAILMYFLNHPKS